MTDQIAELEKRQDRKKSRHVLQRAFRPPADFSSHSIWSIILQSYVAVASASP